MDTTADIILIFIATDIRSTDMDTDSDIMATPIMVMVTDSVTMAIINQKDDCLDTTIPKEEIF